MKGKGKGKGKGNETDIYTPNQNGIEVNKLGLTRELQAKFDALLFDFGLSMGLGRKKYKLNQQEVADMLSLKGTSGRTAVSLIENGLRQIKLPLMIRMADAYGMEIKLQLVPKSAPVDRKTASGKEQPTEPKKNGDSAKAKEKEGNSENEKTEGLPLTTGL